MEIQKSIIVLEKSPFAFWVKSVGVMEGRGRHLSSVPPGSLVVHEADLGVDPNTLHGLRVVGEPPPFRTAPAAAQHEQQQRAS